MKLVYLAAVFFIATAFGFAKEIDEVTSIESAIAETKIRLAKPLDSGISVTIENLNKNREESETREDLGVAVIFFTAERKEVSDYVIEKLEEEIRIFDITKRKINLVSFPAQEDRNDFENYIKNNEKDAEMGEKIETNAIDILIYGSLTAKRGSSLYTYEIKAVEAYDSSKLVIEPYSTKVRLDPTLADLLDTSLQKQKNGDEKTFIDETWKHKILYLEGHIGYGTGFDAGGNINVQLYSNRTASSRPGIFLGVGVDNEGFVRSEEVTKRFLNFSAFPTISLRPFVKEASFFKEPFFEFYAGIFKTFEDVAEGGLACKPWGIIGGLNIGNHFSAIKSNLGLYIRSGIYFKDAKAGINRLTLSIGASYKIGFFNHKEK